MKKHHHLSLIAALVLSACGGGSDNSSSDNGSNGAPADITLSGRALSSDYLVGRTVCLDLNANQQCDSGEPQTTTDSQGRFSFTLPETQQADARQAWAILAAPAISSKAAARSVNQATPTLLGYVDGAEFVVSPYTHQLVTSTDPGERKTQYQSSIATKEKQLIASELGLTTQEASEQKLFGDYLAAGDEHSAALAEEAATKEQQLVEASTLQAELAAALTTDNPQGWQLVTVSIRNLREYNRNQDIWQQIRLQEVVYSKRVDAIETTRTDSRTETFVALRAHVDNWRWAGVPFYLRTGKRMAEGARIISIAFREPPKSMFPVGSGVGAQGPDHLTFDLADAAKTSLSFYGKRPGPGMKLEKLSMQLTMK